MGTLETIFAAVVGVLAGLAVVGALIFALVWEWCAIRRALAEHRRPGRRPDGWWRERGATAPTLPPRGP